MSTRNPTLALLNRLRKEAFREVNKYVDALSKTECEGFRYARRQVVKEATTFATLQPFDDCCQASKQWAMVDTLSPLHVVQPSCIEKAEKTYLVFPTFFTPLKYFLDNYEDKLDTVLLDILRKIGSRIQYMKGLGLGHGNLEDGLCITPRLDVYLHNFISLESVDKSETTTRMKADSTYVDKLVTKLSPKVKDPNLLSQLNKHSSFVFEWSLNSSLSIEEVLIFRINRPLFWDEERAITFFANVYRLCKDQSDGLLCPIAKYDPQVFIQTLGSYTTWASTVAPPLTVATSGHTVLEAVYVKGQRMGKGATRQSTTYMLSYTDGSSLPLFVYNTLKHYWERAHDMQLPELVPKEVLKELLILFPTLPEELYYALFKAYDMGYRHPQFTITQILTERIGC